MVIQRSEDLDQTGKSGIAVSAFAQKDPFP